MNARIVSACLTIVLAAGCARAQTANRLFGIQPKAEKIQVASWAETDTWRLHPHSTAEFVERVSQPSFRLLASGETDIVNYAVFRVDPDIFIFTYAFKKGEKLNGSYEFSDPNGSQKMLDERNTPIMVDLLETTVETVSKVSTASNSILSGSISMSHCQTHLLLGYAVKVKNSYSGPLTVSFQLWNQGKDNIRSHGAVAVDWKASS